MNTREFFQAIRDNSKEQVLLGLQQGFHAQTVNEADEAALDVALECGHTAIADLFMTEQPSVSIPVTPTVTTEMEDDHLALAIVGMSCRFAGEADSLEHFWKSLMDQSDPITSMPTDRLRDLDAKQRAARFRGAFLRQDISLFDAAFFRISDAEAHMMDPQQRLLLEETYHAFEQGGFNIADYSGKKVGVYVGEMTHDYMDTMRGTTDEGDARLATGNIGSVLSGRLAYLYHFLGEALTINTACSSSLVCMHHAARSLRDGSIDMAVVAGVNAIIDTRLMETAERAKMTSPDGACKAFDQSANGYGRGEGVGVILLKREKDARLAGDRILALLRGSAVNQDGASSQLTAPSKTQQVAVVQAALQDSRLTPDDIDFIEAHGTGTVLGDQIETSALNQVFSQRRRKEPVGVSSVKANIGHCEAAAGMAGVIKTVLALQHQRFPGQARLERLNPQLELSAGKIAIQRNAYDWQATPKHKRRAGVSSFGFSGTNAHVVLEEAPTSTKTLNKSFNAPLTFILSAKSLPALTQLVNNMHDWLANQPQLDSDGLYDLAYTLATGRECHRFRYLCQASDRAGLLNQWRAYQESAITAEQSKLDLSHWLKQPGEKLALPLYPFQPKKYWYDQILKPRQLQTHGFVSTYRIDLSQPEWRMFAAHRVDGKIIFPATGYVTLIMQALRPFATGQALHFDHVHFEQPLTLTVDQSTECQVRCQLNAAGEYQVEFHSHVCHAKARVALRAELHQTKSVSPDLNLPDTQTLPAQSIYERLAALDLTYDKDWQLSTPVHLQQHAVYFPLTMDNASPHELAKYLDIALHCTIPLITTGELKPDESLIPKAFRQLVISERIAQAVAVKATRLTDQDGIRLSLQFIDREQSVVAEVKEYLVAKRLRTSGKSAALTESCYSLDWVPHPLTQQLETISHFKTPFTLKELAVPSVTIALPKKDEAWLSDYGFITIQAVLVKRWPALQTRGSIVNLDKPAVGGLPHPHFTSLFRRLFKYLAAQGLVRIDGNQATVTQALPELALLLKQQAAMQPDAADLQARFLHHVSQHIDAVLDGRMEAVQALFPLAADIYQGARDAKFANAHVSAVMAALQSIMGQKTIRILEIGAGTGGTTRAILPHLEGKPVHYVYTDITPSFAKACDDCFINSGVNYRFATLDISHAPRTQGFANQQFDLIIATNVLHATPDLNQTLAHVRQLLADDGLLVMSETVQDAPWLDLTFGLTPGWWLFNDNVRQASPLLTRDAWQSLLTKHGLPCERVMGDTQSVFISQRRAQTLDNQHQSLPVFLFMTDHTQQSAIQQSLAKQGIVATVTDDLTVIASTPQPTVIYYAQNQLHDDMSAANQQQIIQPFLSLLQALHGKRATLALITENMVTVAKTDILSNPFNTTLRGLLTSAAAENSKWRIRCIDIDMPIHSDEMLAAKVVNLIYQHDAESEFAIRHHDLFSQALQKRPEWLPTPIAHRAISTDDVIVITGGTGEIGQALLNDLRAQGYRKFALLARQQPAKAQAYTADTTVNTYQDGLDDYETLKHTWQLIHRDLGKVMAIYHVAGTLDDHSLPSMTMEAVTQVFRAKVTGTYNLHRITLVNPVQQFVLFSSVASFLSSAGQMNHVAANRYLDAMAAYRQNLGMSAVAINWGFWSQIGSAAARKADQLGATKGYLALTPSEALQALRGVLSHAPTQVVLARFDWERFAHQFTQTAVPPRFHALTHAYTTSQGQKSAFDWQAFQQQYPHAIQQEQALAAMIVDCLADILMLQDRSIIQVSDDFTQFPVQIDSLANSMFVERMNQLFGWQDSPQALTTNLIYNGGSIATLAKAILATLHSKKSVTTTPAPVIDVPPVVAEKTAATDSPAIAIIGMSVRFPGANSADAFWQTLQQGHDPITAPPTERRGTRCYMDMTNQSDSQPPAAGFLSANISEFDAAFFNISPEEATVMDPQQRLLLELTWEALEHAGIAPSSLKNTNTSVAIGIAANEFGDLILHHSDEAELSHFHASGNNPSAISGRISYQLGLKGQNIAVNTACSSSLVSLDAGCHTLQQGQANLAIVGASNIILSPKQMKLYQVNGMLAKSQHCNTFSDQADGMVRAEGAAIYILKRLAQAEQDGDNILAVIESTAINQNGASVSFMSPDLPSQRALLQQSLRTAGVKPDDIDWVETHGTGTKLGDPVEMEAIVAELAAPQRKIAIGAVKSNIGHAEAAAGAAGLTKLILALQHKLIPANRFVGVVNPLLKPFQDRFELINVAKPWLSQAGRRRRAVLSSFGFSGTNAQAIISEAPQRAVLMHGASPQLIVLSAKSPSVLRTKISDLLAWLDNQGHIELANVAYTLAKGRDHFNYRVSLVVNSLEELRTQLDGLLERDSFAQASSQRRAFLFTGQGSQYKNMSRDLYAYQGIYRATLDECAELLKAHLAVPLTEILFGEQSEQYLKQTTYAQPAIFALEYALAMLWQSTGIQPEVVVGHSVGEYVAATLAGCMSLKDAIKLIAARGRIMDKTPAGKMLAVAADAKRTAELLAKNHLILDIAGMNHPAQTVLSGSHEEIARALPIFKNEKIQATQLAVDKAFHSRLMAGVLAEFGEIAKTIQYAAPNRLTYISALTGEILSSAPDANYWVKHLREGVNFVAAMSTLASLGITQCCEIGPKTILTSMAKRCLANTAAQINWIEGLSDKVADVTQWLKSLSAHYETGASLNWRAVWHPNLPTILAMPTYPFTRKSYWPAVLGGVQAKQEIVQAESARPSSVTLTQQEESLIACVSSCLNKPVTDISLSFNECGGTSLELPQFQAALYTQFGLHVSLTDLNQLPLRAIAARLPEQVARQTVESATADAANWYQPFPLNPIQYAYWIGRQGILPLGHVSAHGYLEVKVDHLDTAKLERALNRLIERHHMLRMTVNDDGQQCVLAHPPHYQIPQVDLRQRSIEDEQRVLMEIREELSHQIKQANIWPLFDVRVTTTRASTRLHLSFDSLIIDMYSMRLLFDEWYKLYMDEKHELTPLTYTFRDYYFANEALKKQERYLKAEQYWLARIKTMPLGPELPLRCDPAQVKVQTFARCNRVIPRAEWSLVKNKAKQLGVTPTIVLLTLFGIVLGRYSLTKEFLINLTLFRRQPIHPDVLKMLGDFTNVEVFECQTKGVHQQPFVDVIKTNQQRLLADLEHADYDGVEVQRELTKHHQLDKKAVAPIVFTSLLNLTLDRQGKENGHHANNVWQQFGEVEFSITQTPQIWLDHKTFEADEGLVVEWDYVEALFDPDLMARIHSDYVDFIQHITHANWQAPLQDLISAKVLATVRQVNQTCTPAYLQPTTLMTIIAEQIQDSLNAIAIRDHDRALTYAEFDLQTTKVAAQLQARGVKQGDYVAVSTERSCNLLIAIIGVLKAGAVYSPVDPALTKERRDFMIQDSGARVIIMNQQHAANWQGHEDRLMPIEDIGQWHNSYHPVSYQPADLAYLLYTSGSTGNPKGAMIDQRAIVNRLLWMRDQYQISKADVFLQKTPISFDVSIWELFLPLMTGASLFIPKPDGHKDVDYLYTVFKEQGITRAHFVPSMLEVFLTNPDNITLPHLKTIFCSGEALLPNQVNTFNRQFPTVQLENLYGPTEVAVDVTYWSAPKTVVTSVPIGKPLANVEVVVVDKHDLPCPIGVPGELILAGVQVGRGYLNLNERTAQAFITNAFACSEEGKRGYRTGDLACIQADHQIMYLGRFDDQLKINGQRIELGEIQTVIEQQAVVKQAAVLPVFDERKKATLVAFVQPDRIPSALDVKARMISAIQDKQQRDAFLSQLEQTLASERSTHHTLLFNPAYKDEGLFKRKSYRSFQGDKLTAESLLAFLNQQPVTSKQEKPSLLTLLQAIAAYQDESLVTPKYPYPSAGSLYPVKCYLAIGANDHGIAPGYYYFDQVKHRLEVCDRGTPPPEEGIALSLVIHKRLVQPMYGDYWRHFALIEAGQVLRLLNQAGEQMGMALTDSAASSWQSHINFLQPDDIVVGVWDWEPATLSAKPIAQPSFHTWIAITEHMVNLAPGLYEWRDHTLIKRVDQPFPLALISDGDNAKIVHAASAVLFFTCEESHLDQAAREMGQQLMTYLQQGVDANLGLCPLGTCPVPHQYAEQMKATVQLSIALGPVSPAQVQAIETSSSTGQAPRLAQYLQRSLKTSSLTEAMQPQHVITVSDFPTTNNGKLNRRQLIETYQKVVGQLQSTVSQPCTDLERTVHQVWCDILEGKAYDREVPFLSAGGNSLRMNQLSQRLREACGVVIPIAEIYANSSIAALALLIDRKQDQAFNSQGAFALITLVTKSNEKIMRALLANKKADINQQDNEGRTALYVATMLNNEAMVKVLLEFQPNHLLAKKSGVTPLQCAERLGHDAIVVLLKQYAKGQQASQSTATMFHAVTPSTNNVGTLTHQPTVNK